MSKMFFAVRDLSVSFYSYRGIVHALQGVYLNINRNEVVGLVGETGCGKSTVGLSIAGLVPSPGKIEKGEIWFEGENLLKKSKEEMIEIRRNKMAMIFQDPTTSLNPVFRIGDQIAESIMITKNLGKSEAMEEAINLLSMVEILEPARVAKQYPHELSGGMKQRVMIAIALSGNPKLLIADEPTSSLDVTIQAQILELMTEIKEKTAMSVLLITHDMGVIAQTCDKLATMYGGTIVEVGEIADVFKRPKHPYTRGLLKAVALQTEKRRLDFIPGAVPDLIEKTSGCSFHPRCSFARDICKKETPKLLETDPKHFVACHLSSK